VPNKTTVIGSGIGTGGTGVFVGVLIPGPPKVAVGVGVIVGVLVGVGVKVAVGKVGSLVGVSTTGACALTFTVPNAAGRNVNPNKIKKTPINAR
jgi:hypothetical protein